MLTATNGQVSAMLVGAAAYSRRLYYLSVIGTQAELKSLKAGIVTGKSLQVSRIGSCSHRRSEPWRDFTAPIPNSPFHHWIWLAEEPAFVLVTNYHAASLASTRDSDETAIVRAQVNAGRDEAAATALWNSLAHTNLPIPRQWAQPLYRAAQLHNKLHTAYITGDCTYAALRTADTKDWEWLISKLVAKGELV
jgi:hypothetical protein